MTVNRSSALLLFVAVCLAAAALGPCRGDDAAATAGTYMADAQARGDTWAEWALNKLSEGIGMDSDSTKDAAQKAVDQTKSAADETSKFASEKASHIAGAASEKLGDAKVYASEMTDPVLNRASSLAGEAKQKTYDAYGTGSEKTTQAMNAASNMGYEAKEKVKEHAYDAYNLVKDMNMAEKAKGKAAEAYESASGGISGAKEAVKDKAYGASGKGEDAIKMVLEKATDGKEAMEGSFGDVRSKASEAYGTAKEMVSEQAKDKYKAAKDVAGNVGEQAKDKYKAAKDVAGNVGEAVKAKKGEL